MRFYNKYDGPTTNFGYLIFDYGYGIQPSFQKCIIPHGYPTASLLGETLIGALGSVVTQLIIDMRYTEINNTHTYIGLYGCSEQPLFKM